MLFREWYRTATVREPVLFWRVLPNRDREGAGAYFNSATGTVNDAVFTTPLRWNCTHIL